jgi:hypothetical protein
MIFWIPFFNGMEYSGTGIYFPKKLLIVRSSLSSRAALSPIGLFFSARSPYPEALANFELFNVGYLYLFSA